MDPVISPARLLETLQRFLEMPSGELKTALCLTNYHHHALEHLPPGWADPLASSRFAQARPGPDAPVVAPSVWLLRVGWRLQV